MEERFSAARFPFRHDRRLPRTIVTVDAGEQGLDPTFRAGLTWPREMKAALIERGYRAAGEALRADAGAEQA